MTGQLRRNSLTSSMRSFILRSILVQLRKRQNAQNFTRKKTTVLPKIGLERQCSATLPTLTSSKPNGLKNAMNMEFGGG